MSKKIKLHRKRKLSKAETFIAVMNARGQPCFWLKDNREIFFCCEKKAQELLDYLNENSGKSSPYRIAYLTEGRK